MSAVEHPNHYGGKDNLYEAIKVIEAWELDFCLGNVIKYLSRAGKKDPSKELEDLEKALWYLQRKVDFLKADFEHRTQKKGDLNEEVTSQFEGRPPNCS